MKSFLGISLAWTSASASAEFDDFHHHGVLPPHPADIDHYHQLSDYLPSRDHASAVESKMFAHYRHAYSDYEEPRVITTTTEFPYSEAYFDHYHLRSNQVQ